MNYPFEILKNTRNNCLNIISNLSTNQLNKIPEGFNNNIIWNVGHMVVTQQLLVYKLSGIQPKIEESLIEKFKKGTQPTGSIEETEIEEIKKLMTQTLDWLKDDYENNIFKSYSEYQTSYNAILKSVDEAITFNNIHEGLHFGYIMAMRKSI